MTQLAVYEHAREALAAAVQFDEVTRIHRAAEKAQAYARIAKDRKLQADAAEIVARAERKLGIMLRAAKDDGLLSRGGRPSTSNVSEPETGDDAEPVFDNTPFTLAEIGVDKKLSSRAQKAAALDEDAFETAVQGTREKIIEADAPVVRAPKAKVVKAEKPEPVKPLEPRKWHQFSFSVIALCMASDRVGSEAILKLAEFTGVLERDGDAVDFTPEAIEAMGSLASAALKALDSGEVEGPREPHSYSHDKRYQRALEIVRGMSFITAAGLQAEMQIGFNLASRLIEWMQRDGIVGRADEAGHFAVLSATTETSAAPSGDAAADGGPVEAKVEQPSSAPDFLAKAELREAYEAQIALIAPIRGSLTMKLAEPAMRAGYAAEVPLVLMAEDLGHPHGSIAGWANRLGLTSAARLKATQKLFGGDA